MKNEKNYMGFLIHKIWQILKRFAERKPLIYEECTLNIAFTYFIIANKPKGTPCFLHSDFCKINRANCWCHRTR